jgi:hypothetical protein
MKMIRDVVRQLWGDGTGRLARCAVSSATLTVNLQASTGDTGSANQVDRDRFNWLEPGRARIDIVNGTTNAAVANGQNRTIVSYDPANNTITLDTAGGNVTTATTDVIVWSGNSFIGSGTYATKEFPGLLAAVNDTGTYQNINRATAGNTFWHSTVVRGSTSGTNELPSLDRVLRLINRMANRSDNGEQPGPETHRCVSSFGVQAAFIEYLAPGMRYTTNLPAFDMAPKGFQNMGIPMLNMPYKADVHAAKNNLVVYKADEMHFIKPKHQKWDILDFVPGLIQGIWHLKTGSGGGYAAAGHAYLTGSVGFGTSRPNCHGRLDDITELGS